MAGGSEQRKADARPLVRGEQPSLTPGEGSQSKALRQGTAEAFDLKVS